MFNAYNDLVNVINQRLTDELNNSQIPLSLSLAMQHSLLAKAKRIRAILLLFALEAYGVDYKKGLYPAMALEFIHCYSLIHDDLPCMDDDYTRRGRPTNHLAFGEATAILAGDALLTDAFYLLSKGCRAGDYQASCLVDLVNILSEASGSLGMVAGQMEDMILTGQTANLKDETSSTHVVQLRQMHLKKTGAMIKAPLLMAASLLCMDEKEKQKLASFGEQFGLVFQIRDDLLDFTGEASTLGKAIGRDLKQGKLTYCTFYGVSETEIILKSEVEKLMSLCRVLNCQNSNFIALIKALVVSQE